MRQNASRPGERALLIELFRRPHGHGGPRCHGHHGAAIPSRPYAIGHISGCQLNPALTIGLAVGGRFPRKEVGAYVVAQVVGGIIAAGVLYVIASGKAGFGVHAGFAANGYGEHSPGGYDLASGLVAELVLTFMFLMIILCATHDPSPAPRWPASSSTPMLAGGEEKPPASSKAQGRQAVPSLVEQGGSSNRSKAQRRPTSASSSELSQHPVSCPRVSCPRDATSARLATLHGSQTALAIDARGLRDQFTSTQN